MSIVSSDLVFYAAASMPSDDVSTSGGAIDTLRRLDFTQISSAEKIKFSSSNAGDTTQTLTLTGRDSTGALVTETLSLTGTTNVISANTYERLLKAELSATCAGTVTVQGNTSSTVFRAIPAGERGFMAIFRQLASDPASAKDFYCKGFWKNTNGTLTLTSASVAQNADPSSVITHALDASVGASTSVANRLTSPGFTFDDTAKTVPGGGGLAAGAAIGVWLDLHLAINAAALKTSYTTELDGQTT